MTGTKSVLVRSGPHPSPGYIKLAQISNSEETLSSVFGIDSDIYQINIWDDSWVFSFVGRFILMEVLPRNSDNIGDS